MKGNAFKLIFIIFLIVLVIVTIYIVKQQQLNSKKIPNEDVNPNYIRILPTMNLAIAEYDTINPINSKNRNVQDISRIIYEPLINITKDYKTENCIAKEWSLLENEYYLIKLGDKKFSNGNTVTAEDVKYTIEKIKQKGESIYFNNVKYIESVEIIDNETLRIKLNRQIPFFEYYLTFPIIEKNNYNENMPIGTGKYKLDTINDNEIILIQNEHNTADAYKIKKIVVKLYSSMGEVYNNFKMGKVDLINTQSVNYEEYVGKIGYSIKNVVGSDFCYIALNLNQNSLASQDVRKAIQMYIDRNNIVSSIYNNKYILANFPLDYSNYLYENQDYSVNYDVVEARSILLKDRWIQKESTWEKSENNNTSKLDFKMLVVNDNNKIIEVAENIKNQLEQFGIKINIVKISRAQLNEYMYSQDYDMILNNELMSISPNLNKYLGDNNLSNYSNKENAQLLKEVQDIKNYKDLKEKYSKIINMYNSETPIIPLYFSSNNIIYNSNLMGDITPNMYNIFYNIENWYVESRTE